MTLWSVLLVVVGGGLLVVGAEALVRGASRLALSLGIAPLVVGLTVVAYGTSAPELAVSVSSALGGDPDLAVGNVVGSNIFNILVILGLAALFSPLSVNLRLIRFEIPLMIGLSLLLLAFAAGGSIHRIEGAVLFSLALAYTAWAVIQSRRETAAARVSDEEEIKAGTGLREPAINLGLVGAGVGLLVLGSELFTDGAIDIAEDLGVSDLVIGLTLVALGTSLPELVTSILAGLRGERDIAVGNVVGSNIFNILAVLGLTAIIADGGVAVAESARRFDLPVMTAVAVAILPIAFTGLRIARWEGALFLAYYAAYVAYLLLDSSGHAALEPYGVVMLGFALPLTAITLGLLAYRAWRAPVVPS